MRAILIPLSACFLLSFAPGCKSEEAPNAAPKAAPEAAAKAPESAPAAAPAAKAAPAAAPKTANVKRSEWPGWLGPERSNAVQQPSITQDWKAQPPRPLWEQPAGDGFSSFAVVGGRAYTMYSDGKTERVVALNATDGKQLWAFETGAHFEDSMGGHGPRATPAVEGDMLYTVGAGGLLVALKHADGSLVWKHDLPGEFGAEVPRWGYSGSPLLEGDMLIINVGGLKEHGLVAFDKTSGKKLWHTHSEATSYASPMAFTVGGLRIIAAMTPTQLIGVAAKDGRLLFSHPVETQYKVNSATPVFVAPDRLFVSTGEAVGGMLLQVTVEGSAAKLTELWREKTLSTNHSQAVLHEGHLYGFDSSRLACVELATGKQMWNQRGYGQGSVTLVNNQLVVVSDDGRIVLADATPKGFVNKGELELFDTRTWTPAVVSGGVLYLRDHKKMLALDLRL